MRKIAFSLMAFFGLAGVSGAATLDVVTVAAPAIVAQVAHDLGPKPFDLKSQAPKIP